MSPLINLAVINFYIVSISQQRLRIKLSAFDYALVDFSTQKIIEIVKRTGAKVKGPVPLPTSIERFNILISPHVNKHARDQYELRSHKRFLEIVAPSDKTISSLMELNIPAGVEINLDVV